MRTRREILLDARPIHGAILPSIQSLLLLILEVLLDIRDQQPAIEPEP